MAPSAPSAALLICSLLLLLLRPAASNSVVFAEKAASQAAVAVASPCTADGSCDTDAAGLMQLRFSDARSGGRAAHRVSDQPLAKENTWFPTFDPTGTWATVEKAMVTCQQQAGCTGFFLQGSPPADSTTDIYVWFATAEGMAQAAGYTAYQIVSGGSSQQPDTAGDAYEELKDAFFASYDANAGSWQTVDSAQAECSQDSSCKGFFFTGEPATDGSIYVWFSTSSSTATASGYTAYAKGAGSSPAPAPAPAPTPSSREVRGTVASEEWEFFQLTNQVRAQGFTCPANEGNPSKYFAPIPTPLDFDCRLWAAAKSHSTDMAIQNYFSHYGLDGTSPVDRMQAFGIQGCPGECLSAGQSTAQQALQALLGSSDHCQIIMNPDYNRVGIGHAYDESSTYKNYWTMDFLSGTGAVDTSCYPVRTSMVPAIPKVEMPTGATPTVGRVGPGGGWTVDRFPGLRAKLESAQNHSS